MVQRMKLCTRLDQRPRRLRLQLAGRMMQRRCARGVALVGACAPGQQALCHVHTAFDDHLYQGRASFQTRRVGVCPFPDADEAVVVLSCAKVPGTLGCQRAAHHGRGKEPHSDARIGAEGRELVDLALHLGPIESTQLRQHQIRSILTCCPMKHVTEVHMSMQCLETVVVLQPCGEPQGNKPAGRHLSAFAVYICPGHDQNIHRRRDL